MPHRAAAGEWKVDHGDDWDDQPAVAVRAIARAEADRFEAAAAAVWDAAAARGGDAATAMVIGGATGPTADFVNGVFDRVPGERKPGGAPVYRKRGDGGKWLFLAPSDNTWYVGSTKSKDAREYHGWACTADAVADGTLPHEAPAGGWKVNVLSLIHISEPTRPY